MAEKSNSELAGSEVDWPKDDNLGSRTVRSMVAGLDGKLAVERQLRETVNLDLPLCRQDEPYPAEDDEPQLVEVDSLSR